MLEGMYTAAAGMAAQQSGSMRWPTISRMRTRRATSTSASPSAISPTPRAAPGATTALTRRLRRRGDHDRPRRRAGRAPSETGRPLDIAIEGPGYMQVRSDGQRSLTRDGNLQIDAQGRLAMQDGALLEPAGDRCPRAPPRTRSPSAPTAPSSVGGKAAGKITLVNVANPAGLDGGADNRFQATAASGAVSAAPRTTLVHSGRARELQRRHGHGDDRPDGRAALLRAGLQGDPDDRPGPGDRQRDQAMIEPGQHSRGHGRRDARRRDASRTPPPRASSSCSCSSSPRPCSRPPATPATSTPRCSPTPWPTPSSRPAGSGSTSAPARWAQ